MVVKVNRGVKRSFLIVEILMSLSLSSLVLVSAIYFYASFRKTTEEHLVALQLPAIVDACFISIEADLKQQAQQGGQFVSKEGQSPSYIYTSKGQKYLPRYSYFVQILKDANQSANCKKVYLLLLDMHLQLGKGQIITEQRRVCLVV